MKKIFQIGFNKSGTTSISRFFELNGITSSHNGSISEDIQLNKKNNKLLLSGLENYQAFTDIEHYDAERGFIYTGEECFRDFDSQYPDSIFILNFRNIDDWINSRKSHKDGQYLHRSMLTYNACESEVEALWRDHYVKYINSVKQYFGDSDRLLVWCLDTDSIEVICDFLEYHDFSLKHRSLPHLNKTDSNNSDNSLRKQTFHINQIRNAAVFFERTNIDLSLKLMNIALELRPEGQLIKDKVSEYNKLLKIMNKG